VASEIEDPHSTFSRSEPGRRLREAVSWGKQEHERIFWDVEFEKDFIQLDPERVASAWKMEIEAANNNYRPGRFTTFIAYEWSTMVDVQYHYHRNVIFRGDSAPLPFSAIDSKKPEDLWGYLEANRKRGIEALAIPHTPDLSNGLMYDWADSHGAHIDVAYARRRMLNEPLSEISQIKGQSETHPRLSANDEFANFEIFSAGNVHGSYIREAYGRGLSIEAKIGVNPYRFGVVGGSDIHTGLSLSDAEPYADMILKQPDGPLTQLATGSLTGVWAESNTRESIYAALRRKETFATSGSRLQIRFFGGWDFDESLFNDRSWVKTAYRKGVPMGGDLPAMSDRGKTPTFVVYAVKDPEGANLDRAQVIKVWEENGVQKERVFDVVWSGNRKPDPQSRRLPAVGNTVDLKTGRYSNDIGAAELKAIWKDPDFKSHHSAVYYLRVLEIPTARWSTLRTIKNHLPLPKEVSSTEQQRGWSSPIWIIPRQSGKQETVSSSSSFRRK